MANDELFPTIEVRTVEQTNFKKSVYLKPGSDMKTNIGRNMHIVAAKETCSLFRMPKQEKGCSSWDRITGINWNTNEKVECETCPYRFRRDHKGMTIVEIDKESGKEKEMVYKCNLNYALIIEHTEPDKQFVLTVSYKTYKDYFMPYMNELKVKGMEVNNVITRITKVDPPSNLKGKPNIYEFEFVEELNLEVSLEEQDLIDTIKSRLTEPMAIADVVDVLVAFAKEMGITIEDVRARRLVETITTDGEKGRMVYPGK